MSPIAASLLSSSLSHLSISRWTQGSRQHRCRSKQIFGGAKDFCRNFPKDAQKDFCDICLQIFSHEDHKDLHWCDLQKKTLHVFSCKGWAPYSRDFEGFPRFSGFLPWFSTNQNFWGCAFTPASLLLHYWSAVRELLTSGTPTTNSWLALLLLKSKAN